MGSVSEEIRWVTGWRVGNRGRLEVECRRRPSAFYLTVQGKGKRGEQCLQGFGTCWSVKPSDLFQIE